MNKQRLFPLLSIVSAAVILCLTTSPAFGQAATAAVDGTVLDATGSVVPDADVVVANTSLGLERKLKTNGAGIFTASDLKPAPGYTVEVTKTGFEKYDVNAFDLAIGQKASLTISLTVGATGTTVAVTSDAPIVETTKTDVSGVVDSNDIPEPAD